MGRNLYEMRRFEGVERKKSEIIMDYKKLAQQKSFTVQEKNDLLFTAEGYGIPFHGRRNCRQCFNDLAIQIYNHEKNLNTVVRTTSKYQLKHGVDVRIAATGERVNNATLTDEMAERLIKGGLKKYFIEE